MALVARHVRWVAPASDTGATRLHRLSRSVLQVSGQMFIRTACAHNLFRTSLDASSDCNALQSIGNALRPSLAHSKSSGP